MYINEDLNFKLIFYGGYFVLGCMWSKKYGSFISLGNRNKEVMIVVIYYLIFILHILLFPSTQVPQGFSEILNFSFIYFPDLRWNEPTEKLFYAWPQRLEEDVCKENNFNTDNSFDIDILQIWQQLRKQETKVEDWIDVRIENSMAAIMVCV